MCKYTCLHIICFTYKYIYVDITRRYYTLKFIWSLLLVWDIFKIQNKTLLQSRVYWSKNNINTLLIVNFINVWLYMVCKKQRNSCLALYEWIILWACYLSTYINYSHISKIQLKKNFNSIIDVCDMQWFPS